MQVKNGNPLINVDPVDPKKKKQELSRVLMSKSPAMLRQGIEFYEEHKDSEDKGMRDQAWKIWHTVIGKAVPDVKTEEQESDKEVKEAALRFIQEQKEQFTKMRKLYRADEVEVVDADEGE